VLFVAVRDDLAEDLDGGSAEHATAIRAAVRAVSTPVLLRLFGVHGSEVGGRKTEDGRRKTEDGRRKTEDGKLRIAKYDWRIATASAVLEC
jgi:hypothetical protein